MDYLSLEELVRQLSDLEVALLLSLVAYEHCLIETTGDCIDDLAQELALICSNTFDLSYSILDCSSATSIEDIHNEVLTADARKGQERPSYFKLKSGSSSNVSTYMTPREREHSRSPAPRSAAPRSAIDEINVVNIIIAKNLNLTDDDVQVQALQLMRTRKLATECGMLNAPTEFLFIPLLVRETDQLEPPLKTHLNEHLFISHFHSPEDGYTYLEADDWLSDGQMSASSVIHTPKLPQKTSARVSTTMMDKLREASESVTTSAEVVRYIQDIVVFLRLSRAVGGGISARANFQFARLAELLAPLHGIDYLTPSIVALAARKVFRHRIVVTAPGDDRSLQYGSDLAAVSHVLADVTPDSILDGVLALEPPI
ncbi:uncharacterized protein N7482_007214 [Penicillium canariense]|uniref:magnesium chelatase n=1 Tax=Penicillium canariense TaxID=189055 RepID=A0A9W9I1B9_9EURO|nr:uncharacterized protein N7482_007214 [Penicillium canariense]KAJ5160210.1 hypothetical protein N7482_007214 [Penicillium canariense]